MRTRLLVIGTVTLLILFMSCDKVVENKYVTEYIYDNPNPIFATAFIATEYWEYDSSYYGDADVIVSFYDTVPEITINGVPPDNPYYNDFDYNDTIFMPGTKCDLKIKVGSRSVESSVSVPRDFKVLQPADNETISGTDLFIRWSDAKCEHYEVYVEYHFHDAQGYCHYDYFIETDVMDTFLTKAGFLPTLPAGSTWYYGFIGLIAIDGPPLTPGTPGNIKGNGSGFMWAYNYSWGSYFYLAGTPASLQQPDAEVRRNYVRQHKADLRKRLEQMGIPANPEE